MMFPTFALSIFYGIFMLLLGIPAALLFPGQPVFISLIVGVTLFYSSYELWHAVLHLPFERYWQPAMEHPRYGKLVRHVYGFHLMHHWRPTSNLAVVGFWGFALWDHLFRTHRRPENMPLDKAKVNFFDAQLKKPAWPIAWLDKLQGPFYRSSRRIEQLFSRLFLRKSNPTAGK